MKTIRMCDLDITEVETVEEAVKEWCEDSEFELISFEEYAEQYEENGFRFAQVNIYVK